MHPLHASPDRKEQVNLKAIEPLPKMQALGLIASLLRRVHSSQLIRLLQQKTQPSRRLPLRSFLNRYVAKDHERQQKT
ncbi:hypothetical protein KC315_g63 [Hortaea werneckii]|nr:hypothetical protein KC315_g63 [Hortaea werneckii]